MSISLFLDTTSKADIGLIDLNDEAWFDFKSIEDAKPSQDFHFEIYNLLRKNNISVFDLHSVFYMSGPGSYTGMRLSDGFCNILKEQNINVYSDYHFNVPLIMEKSYTFISNAFKGEFFVAQVKNEKVELALVKSKTFDLSESFYSNDPLIRVNQTSKILQESPSWIAEKIKEKIYKPLYYYRDINSEFSLKDKKK